MKSTTALKIYAVIMNFYRCSQKTPLLTWDSVHIGTMA